MSTMTAPAPTDDQTRAAERVARVEARLAAREAAIQTLCANGVPGMPGDGTPVVLHTDTERGLTYTWHDLSPRDGDRSLIERGYIISRLVLTHTATGAEVGGLSIGHSNRALVNAVFANAFEWADENTGMNIGYAYRDADAISDAHIWAAAYNYLRIRPPSAAGSRSWTLGALDAPTDPQVLKAELRTAERMLAKEVTAFVRQLSTPYVDFSEVDYATPEGTPLRGTGIGRQMYLLAAQHLGTMGMVLRASGCQSDLAQGLWARLAADPTVPTRKTRTTYRATKQVKVNLCLDYTVRP